MRNLALWGAAFAATLMGCSSSDSPPSNGGQAGNAGSTSSAGNTGSAGTGTSGGSASQAGGSSQAGSASQTGGASPTGGTSQAGNGGSPAGTNAGGNATGGAASCAAGTPLVAPTPTVCPAGTPAGPPATALDIVNDLRAHMGLACMSLVPEINTSAQKHCDYYQQNTANKTCIANAHEEVDTCAGFVAKSFADRMTAAGYKGSPRSEVMAFSGDPASAIGQWINSVYHRTPLLSPWLAEMGYGMTADCDTIDMGLGPKAPDDMTAVYPYPGQVNVPLNFDGSHEGPTPPAPPSGWPSASPVHLYVKAYTVTSHDVFVKGTCEPLPHQWLPDKEQYILYPDKPFAKNTEYRVVIRGTKAGKALDFDWSFTTKP
ncbi:MAG: CAP domain-containing protein [Myxococcales bacterium]